MSWGRRTLPRSSLDLPMGAIGCKQPRVHETPGEGVTLRLPSLGGRPASFQIRISGGCDYEERKEMVGMKMKRKAKALSIALMT